VIIFSVALAPFPAPVLPVLYIVEASALLLS
jgi:hypothetical protein